MTLVDTNVLLDLVTNDTTWVAWSQEQLEAASERGPLSINDVVFAELSIRYARLDDIEAMVLAARIEVAPMPRVALFLAGKAFQRYRAAGGSRTGVLPDFFIRAHAVASGWPLLTRDPRRYRTHFPSIVLLTPDVVI